jgi:hypothetical protein
MASVDPIPAYFSWRYILWALWSNAITALSILQGAFASILLIADDPANPVLSHNTVRVIILANAVLTGTVAQIKRNNPPSAPPTK